MSKEIINKKVTRTLYNYYIKHISRTCKQIRENAGEYRTPKEIREQWEEEDKDQIEKNKAKYRQLIAQWPKEQQKKYWQIINNHKKQNNEQQTDHR